MKTLCELKRKELTKLIEALAEEKSSHGYLCRKCLRFFIDKKRLCDPVGLKKIWKTPKPMESES